VTTTVSHQRLLDAITARRSLAKAADIEWEYDDVYVGSTRARHKAANDPAQILRDTAAHLRVIERHRLVDGTCAWCWNGVGELLPWPCPDWLDVASSYPESP